MSDEWLYRGEWTGLVTSRPTETESVTRNVEREIVTSIRNVAASVPKGVDNPVRRYCMTSSVIWKFRERPIDSKQCHGWSENLSIVTSRMAPIQAT